MPEPEEPETSPEFPFPWMPLAVGEVEIVGWDGYSYVDRSGRTYWSGEAEPSEADAASAVTEPRTPAAPVPGEVTPLQMRLALNAAALRATVEAAVAAADQETKDAWEFASVIRRDNALLAAMATQLGMTSSQVDDLFRQAATYN